MASTDPKTATQGQWEDLAARVQSKAEIGTVLSTPSSTVFVQTANIADGAVTGAKLAVSSIIDIFYPVGSYYETSDTTFDPNVSWGGTWVEDTSGRVLVASDSGTFATVGDTGGEEKHTLVTTEMPAHNHGIYYWLGQNLPGGTDHFIAYGNTSSLTPQYTTSTSWVSNTGGGNSHNNLQPYIVIKRWHRTA